LKLVDVITLFRISKGQEESQIFQFLLVIELGEFIIEEQKPLSLCIQSFLKD
jgi:hypothetical protein